MDWSFATEIGYHLALGMPSLGAALLLLVAARYVFLATTRFKVEQGLLVEENAAQGLVLAAYLLAAGVSLAGTLFHRGQEPWLLRTGKILGEGLLTILLLRMSIWVNDRLILYRFSTTKEIVQDKNLGVAFCVAGSCVASGLVLNGALVGFSAGYFYGLRDIALFWLLGQLVLVLGGFIYARIAKYDVHELIEYDDNVAVGIGFGAFLVSLGLVVRASLVGAGMDSLTQELPRSLLLGSLGVVGVIAVSAVASLLVTFKIDYEDEVEMHGNVAASTVVAGSSLAIALLIASFIQR